MGNPLMQIDGLTRVPKVMLNGNWVVVMADKKEF
jgi:hypothetical protein